MTFSFGCCVRRATLNSLVKRGYKAAVAKTNSAANDPRLSNDSITPTWLGLS